MEMIVKKISYNNNVQNTIKKMVSEMGQIAVIVKKYCIRVLPKTPPKIAIEKGL